MKEPSNLREEYRVLVKAFNRMTELSPNEWDAFLPFLETLEAPPKQVLLEAGQPTKSCFFIIRGLVRFYYLTFDGKELNKGFYGEHQVVGSLSSLILNEPSRFSVETLEPSLLVKIPSRIFMTLKAKHLGWERFFNRCCQLMLVRNERREAELLTATPKERYLQFIRNFPNYRHRIPQYHVASYLGITPVALSKYKKQWLKDVN